MSMSITLSDAITDVLEANDFTVCGTYEQNGEYYSECEVYSPAGEDVIVTIWHDGTPESFARSFCTYAEDFDAQEHAAEWYGAGRGEPASLRDLLDDADAIDQILTDTARDLMVAAGIWVEK